MAILLYLIFYLSERIEHFISVRLWLPPLTVQYDGEDTPDGGGDLVVVGEAVPAAPRHRDLQTNLQDEEIRRSSLFINFLFV